MHRLLRPFNRSADRPQITMRRPPRYGVAVAGDEALTRSGGGGGDQPLVAEERARDMRRNDRLPDADGALGDALGDAEKRYERDDA
jgi:hypothetical protein